MRATATLALLLLVSGCSDGRIPTYPVRGQVVFPDGAAVRTGIVELRSTQHPLNARGKIDRDGNFVLGTYEAADGAVAGKHQVIVIQFLANDASPDFEHDHGDPVDRRFADYGQSDLELEISESANDVRLEVQRQP